MSTEIKTIKDVIKCVLEEAGGVPLHYEEIRETINRAGLYKKKIENTSSIRQTLSHCSDFELVGEGKYKLKNHIVKDNLVQNFIDEYMYWTESRVKISVTGNLRDKIWEEGDYHTFCRGIQIINELLNNWYNEPFDSDILHEFYRRELKVIFGTKEEVFEYRRKFKGINSDTSSSEINRLKLELINQISSNDICKNINEVQELFNKLRRECIKHQNSIRYAFYRPIKCEVLVDTYPVLLLDKEYVSTNNQEMTGFKCHIHDDSYSFESGYIMMPYDVEEASELIFRPKFYQALYHELFHFIVSDRYRASEQINEGLPELYSEICYKKFLHDFIYTKLNDQEIDEFFKEYMRFQYEGPYKSYHDFVKDKMVDILRLNEGQSRSYETFCEFISRLIYNSQTILREYNPEYMNERDIILDCKKQTPEGDAIFEQTLRQFEKYY